MAYNENQDILSIGLKNGHVISYSVQIIDVDKDF